MNTLTINYGSAVITTRRATVLDNLNRMRLARKTVDWAKEDDLLEGTIWNWITLVTRTSSISNIPYELPSIASSDDVLRQSFNDFLELDDLLVAVWVECLSQINEPINDKKFTPTMGAPDPN